MAQIDGKDAKARRTYKVNGHDVSLGIAVFAAVVGLLILAVSSAFFGLVVAGVFTIFGAPTVTMIGVWIGSSIAFFIDALYRGVSNAE
jgi:uncharacterized MnhB-related membrane protein